MELSAVSSIESQLPKVSILMIPWAGMVPYKRCLEFGFMGWLKAWPTFQERLANDPLGVWVQSGGA